MESSTKRPFLKVAGHLNHKLFNYVPSFNPKIFNHELFNNKLFNHEHLNHELLNHELLNYDLSNHNFSNCEFFIGDCMCLLLWTEGGCQSVVPTDILPRSRVGDRHSPCHAMMSSEVRAASICKIKKIRDLLP